MKNIIIPFILIVLFSCKSETGNVGEIKQQIDKNKKEIQKLKKENSKLEKQLGKIQGKAQRYRVPIRVKKACHETFAHYIQANGIIEAIENAKISPEASGQVKGIHITEGQRVQKGELLVSLNDNVLANSINEVKKGLELAKNVYNKQKALWEKNIGSEIIYLKAKNDKESLEKKLETLQARRALSYIKAPFSGIVDDIYVKEGELASPGQMLLQLVNLSNIKINADMSEAYLPFIKKGDIVQVSFPSYPNLNKEARIYRTGNIIHPNNRTFNIELRLSNIKDKLKPNMMATIQIKDYAKDSAFVVPSFIIKNDITGKFLFVTEKSGETLKAKKVYVETGMSYEDKTVVEKGLKINDQIIVEGFNTVSTGTDVVIK